MITFIPKPETKIYSSRIIKRSPTLSISSFFAISDFYIINPESIDFLLYWICIKRPPSSYISLLQPVSHWTLHGGEVFSDIEEKPIVLIKNTMTLKQH